MEAIQPKVLILRSAPAQPEAAGALHLAEALQARGRRIAVVLLQDAVLCALHSSELESVRALRSLVAGGAVCRYLSEDLAMRGYGHRDVAPGCEPIGFDGLVDLLLTDGAGVAGAF